jgi:hypothetical protein
MISRSLYRRLERLENRVRAWTCVPVIEVVFVAPDWTSYKFADDGSKVWVNPPEGFKEGDPVGDYRLRRDNESAGH